MLTKETTILKVYTRKRTNLGALPSITAIQAGWIRPAEGPKHTEAFRSLGHILPDPEVLCLYNAILVFGLFLFYSFFFSNILLISGWKTAPNRAQQFALWLLSQNFM